MSYFDHQQPVECLSSFVIKFETMELQLVRLAIADSFVAVGTPFGFREVGAVVIERP